MAVVGNVIIEMLITKYFGIIDPGTAAAMSREAVFTEIARYFSHDQTPTLPLLEQMLIEFDREDNPVLDGEPISPEILSGGIFGQIGDFFQTMFSYTWKDFNETIGEGIGDIWDKFCRDILGLNTDNLKSYLDKWKSIGFLTDETVDSLLAFYEGAGKTNPLIYLVIIVGFVATFLKVLMGTVGGDYIKAMNSIYTPNLPAAESLIHGLRVAPELESEFNRIFKENGYSDKDIKLLKISAYRLYDIDTIRQLYLRGNITQQKMTERLAEHGFTPERISELVELWDIIPGIQDILYMVAKEAFEPAEVAKLGLAAEFPEEVSPWLSKQGLSRYWQEKYWESHWLMPSIGQGFEMLHRRIIDFDMLNSLFKTVEIPPFWRDKLTAIAYNPYTRVDIRRMHLIGTVGVEDVFNNYLDLGYDSEHAQKMTEWTIDYNRQGERKLTQTQIKAAYKDDIISRSEAQQFLIAIGYSESSAIFILDYVDYEREKDYQDAVVDSVRDSFINNLMSTTEVSATLNTIGLSAHKIAELIKLWGVQKLKNRKLPSKTDLEKFFKSGIIDLNTYKLQLQTIGYESTYIDWYSRLLQS